MGLQYEMKEVTQEYDSLYDIDEASVPPEELNNFYCMQCGRCCCWPGYVKVNEREIDAIAEHLGMEPLDFIEEYTGLTDDRQGLTILEKANGHCIFFDKEDGCLINAVKPKQCRDFPGIWNFERWNEICQWGLVHTKKKAKKNG